MGPEIWFYHLASQSLERALPILLERTLARGWRAVVETPDEERAAALDSLLWTYADDSFLAHGSAAEGDAAMQPIWLTCSSDNPNAAVVRFYVGGAAPPDDPDAGYERLIVMFDGSDEEQVAQARGHWRRLKGGGLSLSYWRQDEKGRWTKAE